MGKHSQIIQHKPERDTKQPTKKEFYELKQENHRLRRKLGRAEKHLKRLQDQTYVEEFEDEPEGLPLKEDLPANVCPNCGEPELKTLELIGKSYEICAACKYRGIIST